MHKILVTTDPHVTREGKTIIGLDPAKRLAHVLDFAAGAHPDAAAMVITGDLVQWGGSNEYERLAPLLESRPWPVRLMLGNHDNRANFRAVFPDHAVTENGHVQSVIDLPGWRLLLLDSHDDTFGAPIHSGVLCDDRLAWLDRQLAGASDRRVIVFIHHPPMLTHVCGMDEIGLRNRETLLDRLIAAGHVQQVIAGHIHRTISGHARGLPVTIFKSTCHQGPLDLGGDDVHASVDEPGAYGLLLLHDDGVTIHTEDVP